MSRDFHDSTLFRRHRLLTHQEEIVLARAVQAGIRAELDSSKNLDQTIHAGRAAREQLYKLNTRLIVSVAQKFARSDFEMADLIQEGSLGLMRAIEKFDPDRGHRFSTYATFWVRQAIILYLHMNVTIRLPTNKAHAVNKIKRLSGRADEATDEVLADKLDLSPEDVRALKVISRVTSSLDDPTPNGDLRSDYIEDDSDDAETSVLKEDESAQLAAMIRDIPERDRRIFEMRFADTDKPMSFLAIGQVLGISRERVRQVYEKHLKQLKLKAANLR